MISIAFYITPIYWFINYFRIKWNWLLHNECTIVGTQCIMYDIRYFIMIEKIIFVKKYLKIMCVQSTKYLFCLKIIKFYTLTCNNMWSVPV